MKRCICINAKVAIALVIVAVVGSAIPTQADTVAYWRFEGNNGSVVADGVSVPTLGTPIRDEIGNHHAVSTVGTGVTWQGDDAGELFGSQVPNPDPLDTSTNGTLNAGGVNTRSLFFALSGDDHLVVADDDALDFSGAFTIEGYFRNTRPNKIGNVVNKRSGDAGYKVWVAADTGVLSFGVDNGPTWDWIGFDDASVSDGAWHHFAAIRDSSDGLHIWVDGVEDTTPLGGATTVSGDLSNSYNLQIGADTSGIVERAWDGYLDEIRLSNVALTSDQFLCTPVPEPSSLSLALLGLICLAVCRRMRRK